MGAVSVPTRADDASRRNSASQGDGAVTRVEDRGGIARTPDSPSVRITYICRVGVHPLIGADRREVRSQASDSRRDSDVTHLGDTIRQGRPSWQVQDLAEVLTATALCSYWMNGPARPPERSARPAPYITPCNAVYNIRLLPHGSGGCAEIAASRCRDALKIAQSHPRSPRFSRSRPADHR